MCRARSSPVLAPPLMICTTPLGIPAISIKGPRASVPRGVFSEGLTITTFPVTRAGPILWNAVATGELKGHMAAQTLAHTFSSVTDSEARGVPYPSGSFRTSLTKPSSSGMYSPLNLSHQPAGWPSVVSLNHGDIGWGFLPMYLSPLTM